MTRKHFDILARAIATITDATSRRDAATALIAACKTINPSFNEDKFLKACGVAP